MDEKFSKSRMYFEGLLPGNLYTLSNDAYARILGCRDNEEESKTIDESQLLDVVRKIVREWDNMPNTEVDSTLINALEHPNRFLRVMSPEAVYVEPFPLMLICQSCHVLELKESYLKDEDRLKKAHKRIRNEGGRPRIRCSRPSCGGQMVQLPYVSVHRCGYLGYLDIPWTGLRNPDLGYLDKGGTFLQNAFIDVKTGEKTDHALQRNCKQCEQDYTGAEGINKRAVSVNLREQFYPHNIQYLCLSPETGRLVSGTAKMVEFGGDASTDIAEGIASCLIGIAKPEDFIRHLDDLVSGQGGDKEAEETIRLKLQEKRKTRENFIEEGKNLSQDMIQSMLEPLDKEIRELEEALQTAQGLFRDVRNYGFIDTGFLVSLASRRRSMESVLLEHDSRAHRRNLKELVQHENDPIRKDQLHHDVAVLKTHYGVLDIIHYKEINVVMTSIGYTREKSTPVSSTGGLQAPTVLMGYEDRSNDSLKGKKLLYAMPARTEALQVRLDPRRVLRWCVEAAGWQAPNDSVLQDEVLARAHLLLNTPALSIDPSEVISETKHRPYQESAPFFLLHTISHCLLGVIKQHTGYDDKSIMEYLLPMDLSFVLYVTSVKNFTAGGLLTLFKHYLKDWFDDASNYAFNCVFDPVCSDKGGTCSGCVQIVLGCETFNHGLSRSLIHGGTVDIGKSIQINQGFWS